MNSILSIPDIAFRESRHAFVFDGFFCFVALPEAVKEVIRLAGK